MRILLDACVPGKLARQLIGHQVSTARQMNWHDYRDNDLLEQMAGRFDVFITMDKSLRYQQLLMHRPLALLVLRARSNRLADLLPLVPKLLNALDECRPGTVTEIDNW